LDQEAIDATSINTFKSKLDRLILGWASSWTSPVNPRPLGGIPASEATQGEYKVSIFFYNWTCYPLNIRKNLYLHRGAILLDHRVGTFIGRRRRLVSEFCSVFTSCPASSVDGCWLAR